MVTVGNLKLGLGDESGRWLGMVDLCSKVVSHKAMPKEENSSRALYDPIQRAHNHLIRVRKTARIRN